MILRQKLFLGALAAVAAFAVGGFLFLRSISNRGPKQQDGVLPDFLAQRTTGYEKVLTAAKEIVGYPITITNGFQSYVAMNQRAYDEIDKLQNESIEAPERCYLASTMDWRENATFKNVALLLLVRGKASAADGRWTEAVAKTVDVLKFGEKVEHGPLINFLVGSAVELNAVKYIEQILPNLTGTNLALLSHSLHELNKTRLPFSEVVRRERYYQARNSTNAFEAVKESLSSNTRGMFSDGEERYLSTVAHIEVLAVTASALQFALDRGNAPPSLKALVPTYLAELPLDPYTQQPLRFGATGTNFVIYSVGPNKKDESGNGDDISVGHRDAAGASMFNRALKNTLDNMSK